MTGGGGGGGGGGGASIRVNVSSLTGMKRLHILVFTREGSEGSVCVCLIRAAAEETGLL